MPKFSSLVSAIGQCPVHGSEAQPSTVYIHLVMTRRLAAAIFAVVLELGETLEIELSLFNVQCLLGSFPEVIKLISAEA